MYCKACGEPLGPPNEDLHDPNNELGIIDGGVENPDSAHILVVDGPGDKDNYRLQCSNKGQMTKLVDDTEPEDSGPSGGVPNEKQEGQPKEQPSVNEVYDISGAKTPDEIALGVVSNPIYGLSEEQVREIKDWVDIYDGQMPPDDLQAILSDFDGVAKQTATLIRKKYETKLNKEMRKMNKEDNGPSIGTIGRGGSAMPGQRPQQSPSGPPSPSPPQPPSTDSPPEPEGGSDEIDDLRSERRRRRVERRNDAFDKAAEQFANEAAAEMAANAGGFFGDLSDALGTAIKTKAKKDPDWFFEKADKWDIEILDALLEPSDSRKEELDRGSEPSSQVDREVQQAVQDTKDGSSVDEQVEEQPTETAVSEDTMDELMAEPEPDVEANNERVELDDLMGDA